MSASKTLWRIFIEVSPVWGKGHWSVSKVSNTKIIFAINLLKPLKGNQKSLIRSSLHEITCWIFTFQVHNFKVTVQGQRFRSYISCPLHSSKKNQERFSKKKWWNAYQIRILIVRFLVYKVIIDSQNQLHCLHILIIRQGGGVQLPFWMLVFSWN